MKPETLGMKIVWCQVFSRPARLTG
jgi:hypothetical protein